MTSCGPAEVDDALIGSGTSARGSGSFGGDRKWSHWEVGFESAGCVFTIVIVVLCFLSYFLPLPFFLFKIFLNSRLFLSITPQDVNVSRLESPSVCKLQGLSFFDFGRRLGSLALSTRTAPSGHSFHFFPLHSRVFFFFWIVKHLWNALQCFWS